MSSRLREPSVQDFPRIYPIQEQLRFLVRYAILAPSTRNTQPWRFRVDRERIEIRADLTRWHSVADPDRRELYLSLGCAIENLLVAAEQFGFRHAVAYLPAWPDEEVAAAVAFRPGGRGTPERLGLTLRTLLARRSAHGRFSSEEVCAADLMALGQCLTESDLELSFATQPERRRVIQGLHRIAHEIALADPAYRDELANWVEGGAFGTPWPISRLGRAAIASGRVARQLARFDAIAVGSAPLLVLISSRDDDRPSQIRSGQLLERLWLAATARGLGLQPVSAALAVPRLRSRLSSLMGARFPWAQQLVRVGLARHPSGHRTPRRPLDEVIDAPEAEP
jgi:nitroreductase